MNIEKIVVMSCLAMVVGGCYFSSSVSAFEMGQPMYQDWWQRQQEEREENDIQVALMLNWQLNNNQKVEQPQNPQVIPEQLQIQRLQLRQQNQTQLDKEREQLMNEMVKQNNAKSGNVFLQLSNLYKRWLDVEEEQLKKLYHNNQNQLKNEYLQLANLYLAQIDDKVKEFELLLSNQQNMNNQNQRNNKQGGQPQAQNAVSQQAPVQSSVQPRVNVPVLNRSLINCQVSRWTPLRIVKNGAVGNISRDSEDSVLKASGNLIVNKNNLLKKSKMKKNLKRRGSAVKKVRNLKNWKVVGKKSRILRKKMRQMRRVYGKEDRDKLLAK